MGPAATQSDVLEGCGATQLMDAAMAGYHATVFAYGQTGSGKTHTMFGHEDSSPGDDGAELHEGLTIRCIRHIYDHIAKNTSERIVVRASCLEVYNEGVYDLLQLSSKALPLKWDPEKGYWVPGLKHVDCSTLDKALHVARTGVKHRRTGAHALNHESSRSHAILTLNLELSNTDANSADHGSVRYSKISFVDLAGSERVKDTGAAGGTLKEANSINKSLFTLGKVISSLSEPVRPGLLPAQLAASALLTTGCRLARVAIRLHCRLHCTLQPDPTWCCIVTRFVTPLDRCRARAQMSTCHTVTQSSRSC